MRNCGLFIILLAWIPMLGCARPGGAPGNQQTSEQTTASENSVGTESKASDATPAPAVSEVRVVDENQFQSVLDELKGKVVLIDFWGTWCPPCLELLPHTVEAAAKYGPRGFVVVAVAIDDPADIAAVDAKLSQRSGYVLPFLSKYGVSSESVEKFGISDGALPHLKLLDRSGKVVETFGVGGTPPNAENIDAAIERIFASSAEAS